MYDLRLVEGMVYVDHTFQQINIYVSKGKIEKITSERLPAKESISLKGKHIIPGMIDPHVHLHLNVGHTHSADDFESGSKAAAYGGVTTLIDFLDPIYTEDQLNEVYERRRKESEKCSVDYSFHCTFGNFQGDIKGLCKKLPQYGISTVKVFTTYRESNRMSDYECIDELLDHEVLVMVHAEDNKLISSPNSIMEYEASRSEESELKAVQTLVKMNKDRTGSLYLVHISSGHTMEHFKKSDAYFESCPQYFYLIKELFLNEEGPLYVLAPPLRGEDSIKAHKENFYKLSCIGTDHCPFMSYEKLGLPIDQVAKGIGSLEFTFPLMYNLFGRAVIDKVTEEPAKIFGLKHKGIIKVGYDADFAIIDFNQKTNCNDHHSNADYTVYKDMVLQSKVVMTILRGEIIMDEHGFYPKKGKYIWRSYESDH
jgi:dihydropyrimidinase